MGNSLIVRAEMEKSKTRFAKIVLCGWITHLFFNNSGAT